VKTNLFNERIKGKIKRCTDVAGTPF